MIAVQMTRLEAFINNIPPESVYLAVPTARLYLCELYFVLGKKNSWGSKVKLTRQAWGDLQWWGKLPATSWWNGRKIWRSQTRAKLHTDSSLFAWGGVMNLKKEARRFWNDELEKLHITHLELEAVYKTARYNRSETNEWADRLSRDKDLDDWRINKRWFKYAEDQWGEHPVDRFATEILAQLPRAGQSGEEINKLEEEVRPGCKIEIFWPEDRIWYLGIVGTTENEEEQPQQQVTATPWKTVLLRHWTEKLGNNQHPNTTAAMQAAALEKSTADNYEGHWKKFVKFCTEENLWWLPAIAATVQLYMAALQKAGTVKGTSLQPYLSAINSFHEDFDYQEPAKGRAVTRAVKGMTAMQTAAAEQQNVTETVRTYLPASTVRSVESVKSEDVVG
eukprot:gene1587-biopygen1456